MSWPLGDKGAGRLALLIGLFLALAVYLPGIGGGYLFDDFPNIVDNTDVQPKEVSVGSLIRVALSSPASEFKRPLASLTFAANYLATGLDPSAMKLTNIAIHLLNGVLVFILARLLLQITPIRRGTYSSRPGLVAALLATGWMLLPINLTSVLYVVQRMESLANLFVLLALTGYVIARSRMRTTTSAAPLLLAITSMTVLPLLGILAKETAVLVPLYTLIIEIVVFRGESMRKDETQGRDRRIAWMYVLLLAMPLVAGLAWLLPGIFNGNAWARRDFTLSDRLFSEMRIVVDYIGWTIAPTANALSFYHDNFVASTGWLHPVSTLLSGVALLMLAGIAVGCRRRYPTLALGIALYFAAHVLTATVVPLELIYEHRNYFASFAVLFSLVPLLVPAARTALQDRFLTSRMPLARWAVLGALIMYWTAQTTMTSYAWGSPLRLAEELAARGYDSPRAQYELGRTYIIVSGYAASSPFIDRVYGPLERAAALPGSTILPEQALIFFNARMHRPIKDAWWESMKAKLGRRKPGVQDESALGALSSCQISNLCELPPERMVSAFLAALDYPNPNARLQAMYGDYALQVLHDPQLAIRMLKGACKAYPEEPTYHITLARLLIAQGDIAGTQEQLHKLNTLNLGGRLDAEIARLQQQAAAIKPPA